MKMGGRGPGGSKARIFFRGYPIPKTENSADLAHYFPENGGIIPRTLKNGGDASPPSPPVAEPLYLTDLIFFLGLYRSPLNVAAVENFRAPVGIHRL